MSGPRVEVPQPEKEAIQFEVNLRGAPDELIQLVNNIKQVGEQFLYHWKSFPIVLPHCINTNAPSSNEASSIVGSGSVPAAGGGDGCCTLARRTNHRPNSLRELFVTPSFDELDAVAVDSTGEPRRLTGKQLESLREHGEFEVPSLNFPGQMHKWRLSGLLQKGTERTRDTLLDDLALALRFLLVTAKARLISNFFSISQAVHSLITGMLKLLDVLIGVPSLLPHNLDVKLREERCRYLVAELVCRPEFEDSLESLCSFIRRQLKRAATEKFELEKEASHLPVPIPYLFLTPKSVELDLRLYSKEVMKRAVPVLVSILEKETRGWFLHFRERLISELRQQKLPDDEIEREVNEAVMREYLQKVYTSMMGNRDLQAIGEDIPMLLVQQAQSVILMHRAVENVERKLKKMTDSLKKQLEYTHPILSRIEPWMMDKLEAAEAQFVEDSKWSAHEEALVLCNNQHLNQTVYFLHRDLTFMKEREPVLLKELKKVKTPTRSFSWRTQIWLPQNWVVRRCFQGQSEVIPTVLSSTATSITTPRSDPSQPVFLVEKEIVRSTTTRWPFWRWINYCHRTWSWSWNAMFFFGVVIPWCSPVSLRALFCVTPFTSDLELSQVNGTLFPRKSSLTPTLASRLLSLWRHISKSRTHFETKPDTGFIGKGMTRHVDRVWNYAGKGFLGTFSIVLFFPLLCLSASGISLFIALTAPIWMPALTLLLQLCMALVYDLDSPVPGRNRYVIVLEALVWNVVVCGFLQPLAAFFLAVVVCPLMAFIIVAVGLVRCWLRLSWDTIVFHSIIKKRGRIPACDSFVVNRIAGPGLTNNYYFQIRPEQALAAFEAKLELDELTAYQHQVEQMILQPQKDFSQFVEACFGPFSCSLARVGAYKNLEREGQDLLNCLHEKLDKRRRELQTGLAPIIRAKLRLSQLDLKIIVQQGAFMLERFYPVHVMSRWIEAPTEEEFWENKGLCVNDWAGLASLIYADIFSVDFLTPLDDCDTKFRLEPSPHVDLSHYSELVHSTELGTGNLDLLGPVYAPRGNIKVLSPYLDVSAFNPRHKNLHLNNTTTKNNSSNNNRDTNSTSISASTMTGSTSVPPQTMPTGTTTWDGLFICWQSFKKQKTSYSAEKLLIPLPVPHPVHIAVGIHNRDTEDIIPLDSEICRDILRAVEDSAQECLNVADIAVARYRGGGTVSVAGEASFDSVESRSSDSIDENRLTPPLHSSVVTQPSSAAETSDDNKPPPRRAQRSHPPPTGFNWRQGEWSNATRQKRNSGAIHVDLASPEDVTLDTDSTRVIFSSYGTTV